MVKKVKKTAGSPPVAEAQPAGAGLLDGQFAQLVKESAQQIWSAGLAAFAKAQNSGGKAFDSLAAEGARLQKKTQAGAANAEERLGTVASRMSDMAGEVGTRAGQHWDKLESIFEDRVARALNRLGVPSAKELAALNARLDALSAALKTTGAAAVAEPAAKSASAKRGSAKAKKADAKAVDVKPTKAASAKKTKPTTKVAAPVPTKTVAKPATKLVTKSVTKGNGKPAASKAAVKPATKPAAKTRAKATPATKR